MENTVYSEQTTGLKRDTTDKYYTSNETVELCMSNIQNHIQIGSEDICIEPSAGDGSFINAIKSVFTYYRFYDLEPAHSEITKQDYLSFEFERPPQGAVHVIGNPPFGRQSSLAIKFIKKTTEYSDSVSFILPKSFKKDSMKKYFPLNFHLVYECDLPENSFTVNNTPYDVPCVFQIWIKQDNLRVVTPKPKEQGFMFVKKDEEPDISVRRVGVYAGKIDTDTITKSVQSHYFIKFDTKLEEHTYKLLSEIEYASKSDTVGPRSISKPDVITEFNKVLNL
jgi:hypothetical protein